MSRPEETGNSGTDARPEAAPGTRQYGTGREARVAAMGAADLLRERGIAAAALFKPSMGGWIVRIYPGGIRQRSRA